MKAPNPVRDIMEGFSELVLLRIRKGYLKIATRALTWLDHLVGISP